MALRTGEPLPHTQLQAAHRTDASSHPTTVPPGIQPRRASSCDAETVAKQKNEQGLPWPPSAPTVVVIMPRPSMPPAARQPRSPLESDVRCDYLALALS